MQAPLDVAGGSIYDNAARGEAPTADGQSAEAAFILAKHPDGAGIRGGNRPLDVRMTSSLEG
jgi:hypothetical protein